MNKEKLKKYAIGFVVVTILFFILITLVADTYFKYECKCYDALGKKYKASGYKMNKVTCHSVCEAAGLDSIKPENPSAYSENISTLIW